MPDPDLPRPTARPRRPPALLRFVLLGLCSWALLALLAGLLLGWGR